MKNLAARELNMRVFKYLLQCVVILLLVQGCTYPSRVAAVPDNLTKKATVSRITNVRYWMDGDPKPLLREAVRAMGRERHCVGGPTTRGPLVAVR